MGNTLDWAAGAILCPVTVLTNATMNWISGSTLYLYSAFTNAGTINWYRGGNITIYNNIIPPVTPAGSIIWEAGRSMSNATPT